ncbi:hypothetical protein D9M68_741750 [compost metagenome]
MQVLADVGPLLQRLGRTVDDVQALMATQVEHALAHAGRRFRQGQRIAAAQPVTLQAQLAHGIVHLQFQRLELSARLDRGSAHVLARLTRPVLQVDITVELAQVIDKRLAHGLIVPGLRRRGALLQLGQQHLHARQALAHPRGTLGAWFDGKSTLQTPRLENFHIHRRQLSGQLMPLQDALDRDETAGGHGDGQQQHQGKAAEQLLADSQVGEQAGGRRHKHNSIIVIRHADRPAGSGLAGMQVHGIDFSGLEHRNPCASFCLYHLL